MTVEKRDSCLTRSEKRDLLATSSYSSSSSSSSYYYYCYYYYYYYYYYYNLFIVIVIVIIITILKGQQAIGTSQAGGPTGDPPPCAFPLSLSRKRDSDARTVREPGSELRTHRDSQSHPHPRKHCDPPNNNNNNNNHNNNNNNNNNNNK